MSINYELTKINSIDTIGVQKIWIFTNPLRLGSTKFRSIFKEEGLQMDSFIACHECDVIHRIKPLPGKGAAHCIRCGAVLYKHKTNSLERTLAFTLAGLILFVLANSFPFLGLKIGAQVRETTLITGIHELYVQGMQIIAVLVLITTMLAPLLQMMCLVYVLLPLKFGRLPKMLPRVMRFLEHVLPWSMMEVFMIGILVSVVKLAGMAKIIPGISLYSFLALIFVLAAMIVSLDSHLLWQKWEKAS